MCVCVCVHVCVCIHNVFIRNVNISMKVWPNEKSVRKWSSRPGFNPRSSCQRLTNGA